jgi:hypothetical protein
MKKARLICALITLFVCHSHLYSQHSVKGMKDDKQRMQSLVGLEFFLFPALHYNSADLGIVLQRGESVEYALLFGCRAASVFGPSFNLRATFNTNFYAKSRKVYWPFWFRVSNTRRIVGYEEGYHPHTLSLAAGTGFGRIFKLTDYLKLRLEIGLGIALNSFNSKGDIFPFLMNYEEYSFHRHYPQDNPLLSPALLLKCTFVKNFRRRLNVN